MNHLTIGQVAKEGGVNLQTIRYYERRGILPRPPRTSSGYRAFPDEAVKRIRFIKRAQELGFSLKEIKELLSLRAAPKARSADVRARTIAKITDIDEKIRSLEAMKRALLKLGAACSGQGPATECPILNSLDSRSEGNA
jgi:MerR family transcriptional regulator, copper efflux regulator